MVECSALCEFHTKYPKLTRAHLFTKHFHKDFSPLIRTSPARSQETFNNQLYFSLSATLMLLVQCNAIHLYELTIKECTQESTHQWNIGIAYNNSYVRNNDIL